MSSYADLLSEYIKESGLSIGEIARRMNERGVKIDRSYISKLKNNDVKPPSEEITNALAEVTGGDPVKLSWASTIEKSHPAVQKSLMLIDEFLMKKGVELEKKYPIPDGLDEVETDKYIESIPEYREYYENLLKQLEMNEQFMSNVVNIDETRKDKPLMVAETKLESYPAGFRVKIPIIGTVAAGPNGFAFQEPLGEEWADKDSIYGGKFFWLKVKGDSMIGDGILPGDFALVREQPEVEYGDLAVVVVNGEEGTLKRVFKKDDSIVLQSSNPQYPPRIFTGKELNNVRVVGKVKETKRKY